jgi:hypothetical protein
METQRRSTQMKEGCADYTKEHEKYYTKVPICKKDVICGEGGDGEMAIQFTLPEDVFSSSLSSSWLQKLELVKRL